MGQFNLKKRPTISSELELESAAIGLVDVVWGNVDEGKALITAGNDNFVLATNGSEIHAILRTIEPGTVNQGYSYGSVQRGQRAEAAVVAGGTTLVVGDYVLAAAQSAVGTANPVGARPVVRKWVSGTDAELVRHWMVVSLVTNGAAGGIVVIEKQ